MNKKDIAVSMMKQLSDSQPYNGITVDFDGSEGELFVLNFNECDDLNSVMHYATLEQSEEPLREATEKIITFLDDKEHSYTVDDLAANILMIQFDKEYADELTDIIHSILE